MITSTRVRKEWRVSTSHKRRNFQRPVGSSMMLAVLALLCLAPVGCDMDSFMDPSEVGRWENTPVLLPIIERLDVIDEPMQDIPGLSQIRSEDLIPEIREYELGAGDLLTFTIFELITPNVETIVTRRIDELGFVRLPVIGQLKCAGLTTKQLEQRIVDILDPAILRNPTVSVIVQEGRQKTFSVVGGQATGTYQIVQNNFRLLDALAISRAPTSGMDHVYVIRQVPLLREVEEGYNPQDIEPGAHKPPLHKTGETPTGAVPGEAPATDKPALDPAKLIESLSKGLDDKGAEKPKDDKKPAEGEKPKEGEKPAAPQLGGALEPGQSAEGRFVNLNGKWVWVEGKAGEGAAPAAAAAKGEPATDLPGDSTLPPPDQMVTQRVIDIDADALVRGEAKYNIVIRAGDIVRLPAQDLGNVYIGGHISRPGTYALPGERTLTLKQLIMSAGGLAPTAIPERVDLTRRLGKNQEATVRLNLRAIFEGVQPDIYLKKNDTINIGTNAVASFAAVVRNSFRFSYGFGFLLDRNFGSDVLGVAPSDRARR
ncbi:MAG: hypothetical protein GC162_16730 [Planctomycetes bacterium]|nr:hypothetical protein [Planctomycetota bacterium]